MKLNIKGKFSLLIIITLIVSISILAALIIFTIYRKSQADLQTFQQEEMQKVKKSLNSYVDMAFHSIDDNYKYINDQNYLEKYYGHRLQNTIDIAIHTLEKRAKQVQEGKISLQEAQTQAIKDIESMRYDRGTGYIFINDTQLPYPTMIMHPTLPETNGKVLDDAKYNCAMGKKQNLFQAMAQVCLAKGGGYVDYMWPKPTPGGLTANVKKLTYVQLFKEWGWVLGTGIYLDDVEMDIKRNILKNIKTLKFNHGENYFWINDGQLPYPTMVMHPILPALDGKPLNDPQFNCVKGTNQNFFQALTEQAKATGEGYAEYQWINPASNAVESKMSYVKYFKPFNWAIGTGVYMKHIEETIAAKEKETAAYIKSTILLVACISLALIGVGSLAGFYLADPITKSIQQVKDRLQDLSIGKSIRKLPVTSTDEAGEMTTSLNNLVEGMNSYTSFAIEIGKGNLNTEFTVLSAEDTLGNSLIQMCNALKNISAEESVRRWTNEGIGLVNEILRKNTNDLKALCQQLTVQLVKYMKANQSAIYLIEKAENRETFLQLWACYAYSRQKHHSHQVMLGEGLVGQSVLEKDYIYLTVIPDDYMKITSGLGGASPTSVIVFPLIHNTEVYGVIEMAFFHTLQAFEMDFLRSISEGIASSILSSQSNDVTRKLLEQTQKLAEEMKAQEEELRQNSEELLAIQEELNRKLKEVEAENQILRERLSQPKA
ncbi:MAG: cache domain-containing protein [Bacteroidota bacterium]